MKAEEIIELFRQFESIANQYEGVGRRRRDAINRVSTTDAQIINRKIKKQHG